MQYYTVISQLRKYLFFISVVYICSCTFTKKAPVGKYYLSGNSIAKIDGSTFSKQEKNALKQRLLNQLDDSSIVTTKTSLFFINVIQRPPIFDTAYAAISARNMKASLFHIGFYNASVIYKTDTSGKKVHVNYFVNTGHPTLIDTLSYRLRRADIQELANKSKNKTLLKEDNPITKANVLGEIGRLVDTFRNNGYYKFTASELKLRGDTTIEALTSVTDDPFEQLRLLAEAQQQKDSPKIKLALILNPPTDSTRLTKYYINKVFVLPDFYPGDVWTDTNVKQVNAKDFSVRYREYLYKTAFLGRSLTVKSGDIYRQREFINTVNNFSRAGVWKSVNARLWEVPDDSNKVNMVIELMPGKKFSAEASLEASYSATSNTNNALGGNLFGLSFNIGLTNRNVGKEAIKMTHNLRTGIELNNNSKGGIAGLINSQEVSYSNSISFPRLVAFPFTHYTNALNFPETFLNTNIAFNNRLGLFNTQSANVSFGWRGNYKGYKIVFRVLNAEFNYLFNQTDSFNKILAANPFLRYSYNTAFILSFGGGISQAYYNPKHLNSLLRERLINFNIDLPYPRVGLLNNYLTQYIKTDFEYKYNVSYPKTSITFRTFIGVGIPVGKDTALPFFKQYFAGGSNSMRAWPIRGIGLGSQKLVPYGQNTFNNRSGDIQVEGNIEYRYDIARIIPNTLTLRGALFMDAGNIWNLRNSRQDGMADSSQFKFSKFYKELGVAVGTGFRLGINTFVLRFDLGFRVKRPEMSEENAGWKLPSIGFNDMFSKIFGRSDENKRWRYENFNFTFGISYPF